MKKLILCLVVVFAVPGLTEGKEGQNSPVFSEKYTAAAKNTSSNSNFPKIFRKIKRGFRRMIGLPVYACILVNTPADVTTLSLSREKITGDNERSVEVFTETYDAEKDVLSYNYTVSGGRIIGVGAKVRWDLSSLEPGTYTISASVTDGLPGGKSITKTVTIE